MSIKYSAFMNRAVAPAPRRWHIYAIISPETGRPVYVGRTYGALSTRLANHMRRPCNAALGDALRGWVLKGLTASIEVLAAGDGDCVGIEAAWIKKMRGWGYKLFNTSDGEEGTHAGARPHEYAVRQKGKARHRTVRHLVQYALTRGPRVALVRR